MIFLINSSFTIWLPIYSLSDSKYQSPLYKSLIVIECLLSLLALIFTLITSYIIITSRAFHRNLNNLIASIISSWLLSLVSQLLVTPFITGFSLSLSGDSLEMGYHCWWTDDVAQMTPLRDTRDVWPLFLGGFLAWYYICIMDSCLLVVALERTAASWFIRNYEKTSHHQILLLLSVFQHGMVLIMTCLCFWNMVHFAFAIGFSVFINFLAVGIFWFNRQYNVKMLRKFEEIRMNPMRNMEAYSLPARFQAKENVRSFDLTLRFLICGFIMIFTGISLIFILNYNWFPYLETFLVYCMENVIHLNPLIVCPVGIFSVNAWSKALLKSRVRWIQKITNIDATSSVKQKMDQKLETDTYFLQLKNSWGDRDKEMEKGSDRK